jgi:hypothetical protein
MAIATGTATLIAAGVGVASTGVTTAMSFSQANKQKKLQKEAEAEADKAMASARARLDVNYMDALSVQKEPYELQREAMVAQGAQTVDAAQESERGTAAAAGRVQMAQADVQGDIRTAMGKELTEIERLKVAEESRLRDLQTQLDLGEVEGQQMKARNAQEMAAQATAQGWEGVTSMATQAANLVPLFPKSGGEYTVNNGNNATSTLTSQMTPISGNPTVGIFPNPTSTLTPTSTSTPNFMQGLPSNFNSPSITSDRSLKKNIKKVGESPSGLNIYNFEFKNPKYGKGVFQGVMSDEVPQKAVIEKDGYDSVNYSMLDVEFKKIKESKNKK